MAKYFAEPTHWDISAHVLSASFAEMAIDGAAGNEGVAMWLGHYKENIAVVTHVGILRGPLVRKAPRQLMIDSQLISDLTDAAIDAGVRLIAQIHSHGPHYGTYLSETDRRYGIAVPGMLSLVAPDYAQRANTKLSECGVHIFRPGQGWCRFSDVEIASKLSLTDGAATQPLIAGG